MQSKDGGWAAFDVDNNWEILTHVPFADHNAMLDPTCADITGRTLEALAANGFDRDFPACRRALDYLARTQLSDGSWYGRWGVAYIYGTCFALRGLRAMGEDDHEPWIQRANEWLRSIQNPDGGWGESCASYDNDLYTPAESTPSQTAWALMGLMAGGDTYSSSVRQGIEYLIETQRDDGEWCEELATGTGFPKVFYLNYHYYRLYFPLMALATFVKSQSPHGKAPMSLAAATVSRAAAGAAMKPALVTGASGFIGWHVARLARTRIQGPRAASVPPAPSPIWHVERVDQAICAIPPLSNAPPPAAASSFTSPPITACGRRIPANSTGRTSMAPATCSLPPAPPESTVSSTQAPSDASAFPPAALATRTRRSLSMPWPAPTNVPSSWRNKPRWSSLAAGFPVVIVNPTAPMGDHDFKPTPTGQIVVDFLNGAMPAYIDTGLNVVHVRDVALGDICLPASAAAWASATSSAPKI